MKFIESREIKGNGIIGKAYNTDQLFTVDDIIAMIEKYEDENTRLFLCRCSSYTDSGSPVHYEYRDIVSLEEMHDYENPNISVAAMYVDRKTADYKFTISMAANTRGMNYYVSEKNRRYVERTKELDLMAKEAEQKRRSTTKDQ